MAQRHLLSHLLCLVLILPFLVVLQPLASLHAAELRLAASVYGPILLARANFLVLAVLAIPNDAKLKAVEAHCMRASGGTFGTRSLGSPRPRCHTVRVYFDQIATWGFIDQNLNRLEVELLRAGR